MRLSLKIALAASLVIAAGLGLVTFINYTKYANTFLGLVESRFAVIALDVKGAVESSLTLGFDLEQLVPLQSALDRARAGDDQIRVIALIAPDGRVLRQSAAPGDAWPAAFPATWLAQGVPARSTHWNAADGATAFVGVPVTDRLGQVVGGLVVGYSNRFARTQLAEIRRELYRIGGTVWAAGMIAATIGTAWMLQPVTRVFRAMTRVLQALAAGGTPSPADEAVIRKSVLYPAFLAFRRALETPSGPSAPIPPAARDPTR